MVLERHPKKYKHLMRTMLTQLIQHENITTTRAKAKHLRHHAEKLFTFAKKAQAGQKSPLNLLKGRVHTKKAETKLLVQLMPRLKHLRGGFISLKNLQARRKGDNAPMTEISIKGNQKTEFEKKRHQQALQKGQIPNLKAFESKILLQEKEYLQKMMRENPDKEQFFKQKLDRLDFRLWILGKSKKEPPKYTLLI